MKGNREQGRRVDRGEGVIVRKSCAGGKVERGG